jgi:hypothetical protein
MFDSLFDVPGYNRHRGQMFIVETGRELSLALQGRTIFGLASPTTAQVCDYQALIQCDIICECMRRLLARCGITYDDADAPALGMPRLSDLGDLSWDGIPELPQLSSAIDELERLIPREAPAATPPEADRPADSPTDPSCIPEPPEELPDLVTLDQAAAIVNRSSAALRHYSRRGMPKPWVQGTKGKPNEYRWSEMRPWLEDMFRRPIPEVSIRQFRASGR